MVALREVKKRLTISESEAICLCQCVKLAFEHLSPPQDIADVLLDVAERLGVAFDLGVCPSCGCIGVDGDECEEGGE